MKKHTAKDAVKIIIATAKDYNRLLENKNFIFIYRNRLNNQIEYFETVFLPRHFQHLCGVDYINSDNGKVIHNSTDFYKRALNNELSHKEIKLREDGTTNYCLGFGGIKKRLENMRLNTPKNRTLTMSVLGIKRHISSFKPFQVLQCINY